MISVNLKGKEFLPHKQVKYDNPKKAKFAELDIRVSHKKHFFPVPSCPLLDSVKYNVH